MMNKLVSAVVAVAFALASIVEVSAQAVTTNRSPVVTPNYTQNGGLPRWQACLARVKAGTGSCTILVMGESTPAGYGCAYQATAANYSRACSWVAQLAQTLYQEYNIATSYNAIMGGAWGNQSAGGYVAYDPSVTFGASWTFDTSRFVVGGNPFLQGTSNTSTLDFNPTNSTAFPSNPAVQTDSADVYTLSYIAGNNTLDVSVNAGATITSITDPGNGTINKTTVSTTLGTNTWKLKCATLGFGCYVQGMVAYDSTVPQVKVVNGGWGGSLISGWVTNVNGFDALQTIAAMAPDLCIAQIAGNDAGAGTNVATYIADYETLVDACQSAGGDFLVVNSQPANPAVVTYATAQTYAAAGQTVATAKNVPIFDWFQYLCGWNGSTCAKGGWTAGMGAGWNAECCTNAADAAHNGGALYGILGRYVAQILAN
jgi:hypothetical protein